MALLLQALGVLLAAVVTASVLGPSVRAALRPAVALVVVVVAVVLFWSSTWPALQTLFAERAAYGALPPAAAASQGGAIMTPPIDWPFVEWLAEELPSDASYHVLPALPPSEAAWQWLTFRLTPRRATDRPEQADWLVLYGGSPALLERRADVGRLRVYQPGFALARRRR